MGFGILCINVFSLLMLASYWFSTKGFTVEFYYIYVGEVVIRKNGDLYFVMGVVI
jgi:hypothetical protein